MAVVQNTYTGDGVTVLYSLSFPYLDRSDVKVSVNGTIVTNYIFATDTSIQFLAAPGAGASIRIYRDTDNEETKATIFPGSAIKAQDLNANFSQTLYSVQEIAFRALSKFGDTMLGILNMGGFKITNLGTPTSSTDASTKSYVDGLISTGAANAAAAAASASAAAGSASSAAASYDAFDDRYLGSKPTDPALDNDGNALVTGALYFNTSSNVMRVYNGATWQDASANANVLRWRKTAVGGETSLSGADDNAATLTYTVNLEFVYLNGVLLTRGVDYTASNGTSITGLVALEAGDVVEVLSYSSFSLVNVPGSTIQDGTISTQKFAPGAVVGASFTQAGAGAVARTIDSKLKDVVSVKDFGAVGDGVADDTAAIQAASLAVANAGGGILHFPEGTYRYTRLTIRSGVIFEGVGAQKTFLVCTDFTTLDSGVSIGSSIRKPDDGTRASRAGFKGIFFSTGAAGTAANQATYQNIIGINLCACEFTTIEECGFGGFGQGAIVFSRAEAGAEGLGFTNTTQDGNYNTVRTITIGGCGAYNTLTSCLWFKYKANSNKLYGVFAKGVNGAYLAGIDRSNDNSFFGGTLETGIGVARLGSTALTSGNFFAGIRIEGGSGDGYVFESFASNNNVIGGYHTGVSGVDFNLTAAPNNRVISDNTNWLRSTVFPPPSSYSTLHNLSALRVTSINGDPTDPLYIKSKDTNTVGSYPYVVLYNDITGGASGNVLGRIGWHNRDTSTGAAGVSAALDGILEGSGGQTGFAFYTGTGTTLTEYLRLTNAGVLRPATDGTQTLGAAANRWSTVFASTGTINTSDRTEKQQIEDLTEAERAVAVSIKGLICKFKFNDAVDDKGDAARIHVGVIAQDVEQAFLDAGLDPSQYGLFCRDEWWEIDGEPVNADEEGVVTKVRYELNGEPVLLDEDGNPPEGVLKIVDTQQATKRTRLGVRYEELLAFVLAAL
jgi:hypothetical protein